MITQLLNRYKNEFKDKNEINKKNMLWIIVGKGWVEQKVLIIQVLQ